MRGPTIFDCNVHACNRRKEIARDHLISRARDSSFFSCGTCLNVGRSGATTRSRSAREQKALISRSLGHTDTP